MRLEQFVHLARGVLQIGIIKNVRVAKEQLEREAAEAAAKAAQPIAINRDIA